MELNWYLIAKVTISIVALILLFLCLKTGFEGIKTWMGYPRKKPHILTGRQFGVLLLIAVVAIEAFRLLSKNHTHPPRGQLFIVHAWLIAVFLVTFLPLVFPLFVPKRFGFLFHAIFGVICILAFFGIMGTGGILLYRY